MLNIHKIFPDKKNLFLLLTLLTLLPFEPLLAQNISPSKYNNFTLNPANDQELAIVWNGSEGIKRLENSKYKNDFYQLAGFFQPQINPLYCGVASSVIILNAINSGKNNIKSDANIEVTIPSSMGGGIVPFNSYSQLTFLNEQTDKIKERNIINLINTDEKKFDPGLTLDQLSSILKKVYKLKIKTVHVKNISEKKLSEFRKILKTILSDDNHYIVANFYGKAMNVDSAGHISPLVAYDQDSDSVLVLDVATHKRNWFWVKTDILYQAMNTKDGKKYRGYIIISDSSKN